MVVYFCFTLQISVFVATWTNYSLLFTQKVGFGVRNAKKGGKEM